MDREPIGVIGVGWVGLVTAACFAELGHDVHVRDIVQEKVDSLALGEVPIYEPGLSDLIVGKCQASQAIQATRFKGLQVLPCGYVPPNPAELLGSAHMRQVVDALRTHYEWVLIDTPPILAMADTPVLCPLVDGIILVIGAEVSGRPTIQRAVDQIQAVGGKIIGVVLNKVDLERNSYYYSQYYGEYYRSYYAEGPPRRSSGAPQGRVPARRS